MKSFNLSSPVHYVRDHKPGLTSHKKSGTKHSRPQPSPGTFGNIDSLRSSRGNRPGDEAGTAPAPRIALPAGAPGGYTDGSPPLSLHAGNTPDLPAGQGVVFSDHELEAMINKLDAPSPSQPSATAAMEYRDQALQRLDALKGLVASLMGRVEVHPLEHPDHRTHAQMRAAYYNAMSDLITKLADEGRIQLEPRNLQHLQTLQEFASQLGKCAEHNPFTGEDAHMHHATRIVARELLAEKALQSLLPAHLPELLSEIHDPNLLRQLAKGLLKQAEGPTGQLAHLAELACGPDVFEARNEVVASIRKDIELAVAETALQRSMLELLGGAVLQLGEARIHGLKGGANHRLRQILGPILAQTMGIDPRPRGERVSGEIAEHFGSYFNVQVSEEHKDKLDMSLKTESVGRFTMDEFKTQLGGLLQVERPRIIPKAVQAAVHKAGEFELTHQDGHASVRLTEPAQRRLNALRLDTLDGARPDPATPPPDGPTTHHSLQNLLEQVTEHFQTLLERHGHTGAEHGHHLLMQARDALNEFTQVAHTHNALSDFEDMPPQQRLTLAASRGMHSAQLGLLKMSLQRTFLKQINNKASEGKNPLQLHQGLRQAKANLLGSVMRKVMRSSTKELMLAHITGAERDHDALWRTTWNRPHGGETADLLKNMRAEVERFQEWGCSSQGTSVANPAPIAVTVADGLE